jgi:hypothetical protein
MDSEQKSPEPRWKLKAWLAQNCMTQAKLSEELGITATDISTCVSGNAAPLTFSRFRWRMQIERRTGLSLGTDPEEARQIKEIGQALENTARAELQRIAKTAGENEPKGARQIEEIASALRVDLVTVSLMDLRGYAYLSGLTKLRIYSRISDGFKTFRALLAHYFPGSATIEGEHYRRNAADEPEDEEPFASHEPTSLATAKGLIVQGYPPAIQAWLNKAVRETTPIRLENMTPEKWEAGLKKAREQIAARKRAAGETPSLA